MQADCSESVLYALAASGLLAVSRHYWIEIKLTALTPSNISTQQNTQQKLAVCLWLGHRRADNLF